MRLAKAIELSKEAEQSLKQGKFYDHADAVKLCYLSAQRILLARSFNDKHTLPLLPGEDLA